MKIQQINNLEIHETKTWRPPTTACYYVKTKDKRILEEFQTLTAARRWCRETTDFVQKRGKRK